MPWMQAVLQDVNDQLSSKNIGGQLKGQAFGPGADLAMVAQGLGIQLDNRAVNHLKAWPPSLAEALRATIQNAIDRSQGKAEPQRVPVQLNWMPAAGFGVSIWEVSGANGSPTVITVQLQSPMPSSP